MVILIDSLKVTDHQGFGPVDTIPGTGTIRGTAAEECAVAAVARDIETLYETPDLATAKLLIATGRPIIYPAESMAQAKTTFIKTPAIKVKNRGQKPLLIKLPGWSSLSLFSPRMRTNPPSGIALME